ncbi:hypothetical protein TNCV_2193281 [Trichonephila clavipes]|nr:hypothetical protein TNCV_2193281 [Trichonephila clavipes]
MISNSCLVGDRSVDLVGQNNISKLCRSRCVTTVVIWRHGIIRLRVKEDIEDVSSELGSGGQRLPFLDETSRALLILAS